MAYPSRDRDANDKYDFRQDNPTVSKLVQPSDDRQNIENPYTTRDRYTTDSRQTGDNAYESTRRNGTVNDNRQENNQRNNNIEYTRRVPTTDVFVDPYRRPGHGNARTCVMEINISVSLGPERTPQASIITHNSSSKPPVIRSTAIIDDVRFVDLNFQSPDNTAQLATDGIIRRPSSQNSTGFPNKNTDE